MYVRTNGTWMYIQCTLSEAVMQLVSELFGHKMEVAAMWMVV